jgi:L-alanine-DL-glutamate epimerase-like enolase superfamily enzyme
MTSRRRFLRNSTLVGAAAIAAAGSLPVRAAGEPVVAAGDRGGPAPPRGMAELSAVSAVKITAIKCHLVHRMALVELETDAGVTGWGECAWDGPSVMKVLVEEYLAPQCLGQSIHDVRRLWDWMFYENHDLGPGGALPNAIAGIDIALWDVKGRLLGLPVHQLLGGRYRDKIEAYGSVPVRRGRISVDDCVRRCVEFVADGYKCVKVRMQIREHHLNPDPDPTFAYVAAVRQAIGDDIELMVDANNGYSASRAIQTGLKLHERWGVRYFEDPVSDQNHLEMAHVVASLPQVEIVAGEKCYTRWQIKDLVTIGNVDILNPDVIKVGGFTELDRIHHFATCYQKPLQLHNTRPSISTAASLQAMATFSQVGRYLEFPHLDEALEQQMKLFHRDMRPRHGWLHVPEGPGLGLNPDFPALRAALAAG